MDLMKKAKAVVVCANGVVAAWHPKKLFPYEHSLPIDMNKVDKERKRLYTPATKKRYLKSNVDPERGPLNLDLREIFYTSHHEWRPRYRETRLYQMCAPIGKRNNAGK